MDDTLFSGTLCRVCAFESDENEHLFEADTSELTEAGLMFQNCLVIEIQSNDGFPRTICSRCNTQLRMFSEFRRGALRMHEKFAEKLKVFIQMISIDDVKNEHLQVDAAAEEILGSSPSPSPSVDERVMLQHQEEESLQDEDADTVDEEHIIQDDDFGDYQQHDEASQEHVDDALAESNYQLSAGEEENDEDEAMDVMYLEEEGFMEPNGDSNFAEIKPVVDLLLPVDRSDSYLCEKCCKYIKLTVKNHVCATNLSFSCAHCSRKFVTKQRCEMHEARHTTERPVGCDQCDKFFKNKYDLKVHLRSHTDTRSYVCDICGSAFRASTHLSNHIQSHAKTNNFPCTFCDHKYKTHITLVRHIASMHTNKGAYKCDVCGKLFGLKFRYQRHMKIHERNEQKTKKHM